MRGSKGQLFLVKNFSRPAVAMCPERALRADFALGIVDPFLMRTTDNTVSHGDRFGSVLPEKRENLVCYRHVAANISVFRKPAFQSGWLRSLCRHNRHRRLTCPPVVWSIERNRLPPDSPETRDSVFFFKGESGRRLIFEDIASPQRGYQENGPPGWASHLSNGLLDKISSRNVRNESISSIRAELG